MDDKTKKEYEEKAKEQTAKAEAEGRLLPKRKKKKKHDLNDSIIIDDSSVTSTGQLWLYIFRYIVVKMYYFKIILV